jgi:triacylglycerol lipase
LIDAEKEFGAARKKMSSDNSLSFFSLIGELCAFGEFARFVGDGWTSPLIPRTQRSRAILLIPGFLAGDVTLYPFANWLRSRGHKVYFSGILANIDCPRQTIRRLSRILQNSFDRFGEKLFIIGHSLGGVYARELARLKPECVAQTILLGAPIQRPDQHSNPFVKMLASFGMGVHQSARGCVCEFGNICGINAASPPPDVPEAIIFSKSDSVVDWRGCVEFAPSVRSFEVNSTHIGLPYNLETLRLLHFLIETSADHADGAVAPVF